MASNLPAMASTVHARDERTTHGAGVRDKGGKGKVLRHGEATSSMLQKAPSSVFAPSSILAPLLQKKYPP